MFEDWILVCQQYTGINYDYGEALGAPLAAARQTSVPWQPQWDWIQKNKPQ